jgi:hypothetical protein
MPYFDRMNERTNGLVQAFHSSSLHLTWTTALNVVCHTGASNEYPNGSGMAL